MLILLPDHDSGTLRLADGSPVDGERLDSLAGQVADHGPVVLAVPGEQVLLTRARVVAKSRQRLRQAVPFALEDRLLDDVGELHFALGEQEGDHVVVAVTSASSMRDWLERVPHSAKSIEAMVPDELLLPWRAGSVSVAFDRDRALVRTGVNAGFVCDRDSLAEMLARAGTGEGAEIRIWGIDTPVISGPLASRVVKAGEETAGELISACQVLPGVDLMEGDFRPASRSTESRWWWRLAAVAAGVWIVLNVGYWAADYRLLSARSESLEREIEAVFRETFPEGERMVNPRVQMERALAVRGAGGDGLLPVLDWLTPVVARTVGLDPVGLDYRDGQLDLDLRASELPVLDRFRQGLEAEGRYQVELQSAVQNADGVRGIVRVTTTP